MIANGITIGRILLSLSLLVLSSSSPIFAVLYVLCGITDVLDGFLARKLHTVSLAGERLDSAADLVFAAAYAVKILPLLRLPLGIWIWTVWIAVIKICGIVLRSKKKRKFYIAHSFANRLTGLLLFLLPMTVGLIETKYSAVAVCTAASLAAAEEWRGQTEKCRGKMAGKRFALSANRKDKK